MIISSVIERLKDIEHPIFQDRIAGAADYFAQKTGGNLKAPCIYVIYGTGRQAGTSGSRKRATFTWRETFMVSVIAKPNCVDDDYTQSWVNDIVDPIQAIIWDALVGWCPDGYGLITPVNTIIGKGGEDNIEIMLTFQTERDLSISQNTDIENCTGKLLRFNAALGCDPCDDSLQLFIGEKKDCENETIESEDCGTD